MEIKWESNSKVKHLSGLGLIKRENIIPRTKTKDFPADCATVRMKNVRSKRPWTTIHIRGETAQRTNWSGYNYVHAPTMRVHFGHDYRDYSVNGELHGALDFSEVDQVVKDVRKIMGI